MAATWLAAGGKLPFGVKPPQPVVNAGHPLAQGLVFDANYFHSGGAGLEELAGRTRRSTYTGGAASIGPHGQARTYAGGAATDRDVYVSNASVNSLGVVTIEFLFKPNGAGGGNTGRILYKGGAGGRLDIEYADLTGLISFSQLWSTTAGDWSTPAASIVSGAWHHVVIAYSFSSTANVPTIWINGVAQTLTTTTSPAGSAPTDSTSLIIGNRDDNVRAIAADISHVRIWNRRLAVAEIEQLYADPFQLYVRPAPSVYWAAPDDGAFTGTGAATLVITASATGVRGVAGTASATLALAASGTGSHIAPVTGTGAATLALAASATGKHGVTGTAGATLAITTSASGGHGVAGTASATLTIAASGAGSFSSGVAGTGSAVLGVTGSGVGKHGVSGAAAAVLVLVGAGTGAAAVVVVGVGASVLILTGSGVGLMGWAPVPPNPETWTGQPATSETWTAASPTSETWTAQSPTSETWTPATPNPETWH